MNSCYTSVQEWQGLHPQKFYGGRVHLAPKDEIGKVILGKDIQLKSKRHFEPVRSSEYHSMPCIKTFKQKNITSELKELKKLHYVPPQRKVQLDALEHLGQTNKKGSEKDKFHRRIGMMTLRQSVKYQEQKKLEATLSAKQQQQQQQQQNMSNNLSQRSLNNGLYNSNNRITWLQREQLEQDGEEKKIILELDNWCDEKIYEKQSPKTHHKTQSNIYSSESQQRRNKQNTMSQKHTLTSF